MNVFSDTSNRRCGMMGLRLGFAGATTALVIVTWLGILLIQREIVEVKCQASEHTSLLEQATALQASSHTFNERILSLQQDIQSLRARLPNEAEETQFLQQLSEKATLAGVSLGDFYPGNISKRASCTELELRVGGAGTYVALARWLQSLSEVPRMFRLSEISISAPVTPHGDCTINIRIDLLFGISQEQLTASTVNS